MTRAKAWVRVSGVRSTAFKDEIDTAKLRFPYLRFVYPSPEELKIMRRDLEEEAVVRLKLERMLEEVAQGMSREEIEAALDRLQRRSSRVVTSHAVRRKRKK
jgi:superfamily I DNA and RNA helicase